MLCFSPIYLDIFFNIKFSITIIFALLLLFLYFIFSWPTLRAQPLNAHPFECLNLCSQQEWILKVFNALSARRCTFCCGRRSASSLLFSVLRGVPWFCGSVYVGVGSTGSALQMIMITLLFLIYYIIMASSFFCMGCGAYLMNTKAAKDE